MGDKQSKQDALIAQLNQLNERVRHYAARIWQVPFAYLGLVLLSFNAWGSGEGAGRAVTIIGMPIVGILVLLHHYGLIKGNDGAVVEIRKVEGKLKLDKTAGRYPCITWALTGMISVIIIGLPCLSCVPSVNSGLAIMRSVSWVDITLTVLGAGVVTIGATWWALGQHGLWRKEDRRGHVRRLLRAAHIELSIAMDSAQTGKIIHVLNNTEVLRGDVGYRDLPRECRKSVNDAYRTCNFYKDWGGRWHTTDGPQLMKLVELWPKACRALNVIEDEAFAAEARLRVAPPKLSSRYIALLRDKFGGTEKKPTPEVDAIENELHEGGWLQS